MVALDLSIYSVKANNLSDLTNIVTARANLGLGTAAVEAATSFATAAQGLKADTAIQQATFEAASIGYGQTWQTVTRTAGTTYTNSTGKPIMLAVFAPGTVPGATTVSINVDSSGTAAFAYAYASTGNQVAVGSIIIPKGATYVISETNVSGRVTRELR